MNYGTKLLIFTLALLCLSPISPVTSLAEDLREDVTTDIYDPIEPFNRSMYVVNDNVDRYFLGPVSQGYDYILPDVVQEKFSNFFENVRYPIYLVSDVVQFKFSQVATHTGRFLINSTLGLVGLFDVATEFGLERHSEDFGIALAYHGVAPGPYIFLPIVGPTNLRDGVGRLVDLFLHPFLLMDYAFGVRAGISDPVGWGGFGVQAVNVRASLEDAITTTRESSVDPYVFTQTAYYQMRDGMLNDGAALEDDEEFLPETE